jgi:hypothetical protein
MALTKFGCITAFSAFVLYVMKSNLIVYSNSDCFWVFKAAVFHPLIFLFAYFAMGPLLLHVLLNYTVELVFNSFHSILVNWYIILA